MNFIIKRVLKKLWNRKKIYLVVILQISIAVLILNIFLNLSLGIAYQLDNLVKQNKETEFIITAEYKNPNFFNAFDFDVLTWGTQEVILNEYKDLPFNITSLSKIENEFSNINFDIQVKISLEVIKNGQISTYYLIYNSFYKEVRMNSELIKDLTQSQLIQFLLPRNFPFTVEQNQLITLNNKKYNIIAEDEENYNVYIPIEVYEPLYHPKDLPNIKLVLNIKEDIQEAISKINNIIVRLSEENKCFNYNINSEYYDLLKKVNTAYEQSKAINFLVMILVFIMMIGLSGVFAFIVNTRKREIAICLALGATKMKMCLECLIEVLFLSISGCIIGLIISHILVLQGIEYATVKIEPHLVVLFIEFIISCLVAFISIVPAFLEIKSLMPMEILRAE